MQHLVLVFSGVIKTTTTQEKRLYIAKDETKLVSKFRLTLTNSRCLIGGLYIANERDYVHVADN